ncbi:MAG: hypothetical protein GX376_02330 [Firmicutes bacterium]|nr:hypothetical protein [Bacillota bacterium]
MDRLNFRIVVIMACLFLCCNSLAAAANEDEYLPSYSGPEEPGAINPLSMLGRLFFSLVVVITLFYISAKFLKSKWGSSTAAVHMAILDRLVLGVNKDIYIVRLGQDYLVLGVTGENISLLQKVEEPDLLTELQMQQEVGEGAFEKILSRQGEGKFLSLSALEARLAGAKKTNSTGEKSPRGKERNQ